MRSLEQIKLENGEGVPVAILSACRADRTKEENAQLTELLKINLTKGGFVFEAVCGSYKGVEEQSFVVEHGGRHADLRRFLVAYSQECYLVVDGHRRCFLYYADDTVEALVGKLTPILKEEALKLEAWTLRPDGTHYAIKEV